MQWSISRIASVIVVVIYLIAAVQLESVMWAGKLAIYLILPFAAIWFPQKSIDYLFVFATLDDMFGERSETAMLILGWILLSLPAVLFVVMKLPDHAC